MISARKAKHLDATTMFTYSHANTPLSQSEHAYYLSCFVNIYCMFVFCRGELLLWDLSKEGKEQCQMFGLGHSRIVFNISCDVGGTRIMTVSMDRQVQYTY